MDKRSNKPSIDPIGFDVLDGPGAAAADSFRAEVRKRQAEAPLTGSLDKPCITAHYPGSQCHTLINLFLRPERRFEFLFLKTEPGHGFPLHTHGYGDELYLVISGEICAEFAGASALLRARDLLFIPAGVEHGFWVPTGANVPAEIFCVNAPAVDPSLRTEFWSARSSDIVTSNAKPEG